MGPPIQVYLTSIASAPALRQRQEHLLRTLQVKKIPFTSYDLASDEDAKKLWRRKAPANNAILPGILVGGEFAGTYAEFDEAVEFGELDRFFRLKEAWGEEEEALTPAPAPQKAIGVPGVATPLQVTGQKPSFSPSPSKPPKKPSGKSVDLGSELSGFGFEGLKVSEEEMLELVESLGLGGDDADDLVKGLGLSSKPQPLKAKLEAAATIPNTPPTLQTTTKEESNTDIEPSAETATAPSNSGVAAQIDKESPVGGATSDDKDPKAGDTTDSRRASEKPENTPSVKIEDTEGPEGGSSPKVAQPDAGVASAGAPRDGSSATDDTAAAEAGVAAGSGV